MIVEGGRVKSEKSFFQFPSDRAKLILWCSLIKRQHGTENNAISKSSVVCDLHFESTSVKRTPFGKRKMLLPNALPTLRAWNNWGNDRLQAKSSESPCTDNSDSFQSLTQQMLRYLS